MTGGGDEEAAPFCDSCVTCGDVAVRVRVVGLLPGGLALVGTGAGMGAGTGTDTGGAGTGAGTGTEEISVALVEARVGDTVLVHAGEAIAVVERAEA
ncbi:HypC/HybG/HupF family hydrogenase formation chaperone [Nonomuraea sp. B1E8]|uniref:HypC/HybG/HupF family hydrogenase formation chaperone n=1 Tax=unclassified Nonomuraea TaxID=2593643 RepID=UPI00325F9086